MSDASRPPYSRGHDTTAHRLSKSVRSQSRCNANPSRVSPDGRSCGTFAVSHWRASPRNASSASVNLRSTYPTPLQVTDFSSFLDDDGGAVAEEALVRG